MRSLGPLGVLGLLLAAPVADAATLTGTVTGPDGAPFRGPFVQARHAGLKMTVSVLSDNQGHFLADNLPAGEYRLQVRAVGFKNAPRRGATDSSRVPHSPHTARGWPPPARRGGSVATEPPPKGPASISPPIRTP